MAAQQPPDIDQMIQAFINAANAAAAAAAAAPPPPGPPVPFALLPGAAFNAPLDYNKASELKLFRSATTGMADKFDLKEEHMRVFLGNIKEHARTYDWQGIIMIPDADGIIRNLITNYGQLTLANVNDHAAAYINTQTRNAQNSMMMYQYLLNSLTEEAKLVMITMESQYQAGANNLPVGALFLKTIVGRASIDTKAKILLLRESVSHLYMKMIELKGNVRIFNQYVSELKSALAGRGQEVSELMMHLFKAYENVPDQQFCRYIEGIRDRYDADIEDRTADELMQLAVNKYDLLEQRNAMPTDSIEKIVALQASLSKSSTRSGRDNRNRSDFSWKKVPPKANEPTTISKNGQTYHYCVDHKAWCIHTPADCHIRNKRISPTVGITPTTSNPNTEAADKIVINKAYQAILHDESEDDE
jgi:hypothetical protein